MTYISDSSPLTIADHTLLMQALLDRPLHIVRHLDHSPGSKHSQEQVLDAALRVSSFDEATKSRLRRVRDLLPALETAKSELPASFVEAMDGLRDGITGASMEEKMGVLERARATNQGDELVVSGIDFAEQILQDGKDTLYSPEGPLAELVGFLNPTTDSALADVAAADAIGGAIGGGIGLLAAGIGAVPGAAAGAAGGSAGAVVGEVIIAVIEIASV